MGLIILMGFLIYPAKKGEQTPNHIPWYDLIFMIAGTGSYLYFTFHAEAIVNQGTRFEWYQIIIGIIAIAALIEVTRRCVGIPILIVAAFFVIYALGFGLTNPEFLGRVKYLVRNLFYTKEGIFSTPVNVCSKYIVVFIVYFIAFVICTVIDIIMGIIYGTSVDSSMAVFALILVNIFLNAVEMPLCYRFGSERGGLIRIAITLFVVVAAVTYLLFGNIEWLMGEDGIFWIIKDAKDKDINIMNVAFDRVSKALKNLSLLGVIISSMIPHIVVVVYYISYRISCKVYKKGVVRDDI
jgi:hypothetical protein